LNYTRLAMYLQSWHPCRKCIGNPHNRPGHPLFRRSSGKSPALPIELYPPCDLSTTKNCHPCV